MQPRHFYLVEFGAEFPQPYPGSRHHGAREAIEFARIAALQRLALRRAGADFGITEARLTHWLEARHVGPGSIPAEPSKKHRGR